VHSTTSNPIVELDDVTLDYPNGVRALDSVTLSVFEDDFVGLIGPNGAGKSTLINIILGLQKPSNGTVRLFRDPISPNTLKLVGYVPQRPQPIDPNFPSNVYETILLGRIPQAGVFHRFKRVDHDHVEHMMKVLGISDLRDRKIGELSGGQSQRVFVAKALVGDPRILLLDEPTSGVDARSKKDFYDLLESLNRDSGITIIISSHELSILKKLANTLVFINGSILFHGSPTEFSSGTIPLETLDIPEALMSHRS
jgi:zinc transport system ATP-binding protein